MTADKAPYRLLAVRWLEALWPFAAGVVSAAAVSAAAAETSVVPLPLRALPAVRLPQSRHRLVEELRQAGVSRLRCRIAAAAPACGRQRRCSAVAACATGVDAARSDAPAAPTLRPSASACPWASLVGGRGGGGCACSASGQLLLQLLRSAPGGCEVRLHCAAREPGGVALWVVQVTVAEDLGEKGG